MLKEVPLDISYRLIGPGPIVLVSSFYGNRPAISPIAWHMPVSDDPPIVALEIWKGHFIHKAILKTRDFVINIPSGEMVDAVRGLGSISGRRVDKFKKFGLRQAPSRLVRSPRLEGAIGVLECRLRPDRALLKKYSVILGDVVWAEAEEGLFTDRWRPEVGGRRMLHHLGGKVFSVPERKVI
jgi:flavin reductase (DIM6/NTAB) family NADH-FMN oxidoreductase RutF